MGKLAVGTRRGQRPRFGCWLIALAACALPRRLAATSGGSANLPADTAVKPIQSKRQVLKSFPAGQHSDELSLEDCSQSARPGPTGGTVCVFALRLFREGKEVDRIGFFPPSCGPARPTSVTPKLGADRAATAWETSD